MPSIASCLAYEPDKLDKGPLWSRAQAQQKRDKLRTIESLEVPVNMHPAPRGRCGVYFLWKDSEVVYVGQSLSITSRVGVHAGGKDFDSYSFTECDRDTLDFLESYHIHRLRPKLNAGPNRFGELLAPLRVRDTEEILASYMHAKETHEHRKQTPPLSQERQQAGDD